MKKFIPIISGLFILAILFGFANLSEPGSLPTKKLIEDLNTSLNPKLYPLYLTKNEMTELLSLADNPDPKKHRKIVFRFYFTTKKILSLVAYTGKRNHYDFEKKPIELNPYDSCNTTDYPDIDSVQEDLYLGDLEIKNQDSNWATLIKLVNIPDNNFFVFKPSIVPDWGNPAKKSITFQIYTFTNKADICNIIKFATGASGVYINPSPPRGGN